MDYEKYIKALLLRLNQYGFEIQYVKEMKYSEKFNAMITVCYLKIWHDRIVIDEKTGKEVVKYWCDTKEFKGATKYASIIKYLQKVGEAKNDE